MKYIYFVSYFYSKPDGEGDFGNAEITFDQPVTNSAQIQKMVNQIRAGESVRSAAVISFQLLRREGISGKLND